MTEQHLLAGAARREINPPAGIAHASWGAQVHERAEGQDMDLLVTALALSDGLSSTLVLDIDMQIFTTERADQLRSIVAAATGLTVDQIRVSASHTHSAPTPYKSWITQGWELVGPWFERVFQRAAVAASEALGSLVPVEVRAGRGECGINTNRRATAPDGRVILGKNPAGFVDHEVRVVRLTSVADGSSVVTIVNYACHPTVMGPTNRLITPDYPGQMRQVVESAVGGKCLFLLGAAGDQGPVQGFQDNVRVYHRLGETLGHAAAQIALELECVPVSTDLNHIVESGGTLGYYQDVFNRTPALPLLVRDVEIPVPLREDIPPVEAARNNATAAHAALQSARDAGEETAIREAIVRARRADLKLRLAEDFNGRTDVGVRTHFICFGDVAMVASNIEPFAAIGAHIKQHSPFPVTLVSGYTNGRLAYMPTPDEWLRGGHEVVNSPFGQFASNVYQAKVLEILQMLRCG
jgi:hypothetical protein